MPELRFTHIDDVPWREVRAQRHGDRRVSVHEKTLAQSPEYYVVLGRYDPGMIVRPHGHKSHNLVYVLEGELMVGDRRCPPGTNILLEQGATMGPLIAGERGALLYEVWMGDPTSVPVDQAAFEQYLAAKGIEPLPARDFAEETPAGKGG